MSAKKSTRYVLEMANHPGELTKLTRLLAEEGVSLAGISVASAGDMASIEFSAVAGESFSERLKTSGFSARIAP